MLFLAAQVDLHTHNNIGESENSVPLNPWVHHHNHPHQTYCMKPIVIPQWSKPFRAASRHVAAHDLDHRFGSHPAKVKEVHENGNLNGNPWHFLNSLDKRIQGA